MEDLQYFLESIFGVISAFDPPVDPYMDSTFRKIELPCKVRVAWGDDGAFMEALTSESEKIHEILASLTVQQGLCKQE